MSQEEEADRKEREESRKQHFARQQLLKQQILKHQLKGAEQTASKADFSWDIVPVDSVGVDDLEVKSFRIFRKLTACWYPADCETITCLAGEHLLQYLLLLDKGRLSRAAVLLFHNDPGSIFPGFGVNLIKDDTYLAVLEDSALSGSLAAITNFLMCETCTWYKTELRMWVCRTIANALVNHNYAAGRPVEIYFGDEELSIRSCCILPDGWSPEALMRSYMTEPFNPVIAHAFCSGGFYYPECDPLEEQDFGVPKCTVQGGILTLSLEISKEEQEHQRYQKAW